MSVATAYTPRPLTNPDQGPADASLTSTWNYLEPALHHILRSPSNNTSGKAPTIDFAYYTSIHSAIFNYSSSSRGESAGLNDRGTALYKRLDLYLADVARETLLGAPHDDATLIEYYVPCFNRYVAGMKFLDRLFNYVNRHYVKRLVDEGGGWLRWADLPGEFAVASTARARRERSRPIRREQRVQQLQAWGYEQGGDAESLAVAEAHAEAASPLDRIIPIFSLGLRRWRTEVVEPLLSPESDGKEDSHTPPPTPNTDKDPKARLDKAVKDLLEPPNAGDPASIALVESLANSLKSCGIHKDHPFHKQLDEYITSNNGG